MKQNSLLIISALFVPLASFGFAASTLNETFTGATTTGTTISSGGRTWSSNAYKGSGGSAGIGPVTHSTSVGNNAGNTYGSFTTSFPNKTGLGSGYMGGELRLLNYFQGADLGAFNLADLSFSIDLSATSTAPLQNILILFRQNVGGDTHRFTVTPNANGSWGTYTFSLNSGILGTFTDFDPAQSVDVYIQIGKEWASETSAVTSTVNVDNFIFTAVPEVSTALLGFAALPLLMCRRRSPVCS